MQVTETDAPSAQVLENNTFAAFPDMDASPTKAWLIAHRHDPDWKQAYHYAFGKRPQIELYDLKRDPDQIMNVAGESKYAETKLDLVTRLSRLLKDVGDPGAVGDGKMFERPPFVGESTSGVGAKKRVR